MYRVVHTIKGECEISLRSRDNFARIHISETDSESTTPAEFEIEGSIPVLRELFSSLSTVIAHADAMNAGEMN